MITYRGYKIIESVFGAAVIVGMAVLLALDASLPVTVVYCGMTFAAMVVTWFISRRKYPQWKKLMWDFPWKLFIPDLIIAIIVIFFGTMYDIHIAKLDISTIPIFFVLAHRYAHDLWLMKKFEIDRFTSVEELVAAYPEAREKIDRPKV